MSNRWQKPRDTQAGLTNPEFAEACSAWANGGHLALGLWCSKHQRSRDYRAILEAVWERLEDNSWADTTAARALEVYWIARLQADPKLEQPDTRRLFNLDADDDPFLPTFYEPQEAPEWPR